MVEPRFFPRPAPLGLEELLALTGAAPSGGIRSLSIVGVAPVDLAGPSELAFVEDDAGAAALPDSRAGACLLPARLARLAAAGTLALVVAEPFQAFARVAAALFPAADRPRAIFGPGVAPGAAVHPDARLEPDVRVDPGAVIGPRAEIGRGAVIGANAVIGPDVRVGRGAAIGAGATVSNALIGDRVVIGPGARIGQAGVEFGAPRGTTAGTPQIGRVIVQDGVVIGANAAVDRGAERDTVIGESARIDNLVQIGHDVVVGRGAVVFAEARIAGGTRLADFAVLGRPCDEPPDGRRAAGS